MRWKVQWGGPVGGYEGGGFVCCCLGLLRKCVEEQRGGSAGETDWRARYWEKAKMKEIGVARVPEICGETVGLDAIKGNNPVKRTQM